jgi:hypothetical protein
MDASAWAYRACQGRMDLLEKLTRESGSDRRLAFEMFRGFLAGGRGYVFPKLPEVAKEKEKTLELLGFFEQFTRDLLVERLAPSPQAQKIHQDLEYASLGDASAGFLERLWTEIAGLKKAVELNADRTLNLENLWFRIQEM